MAWPGRSRLPRTGSGEQVFWRAAASDALAAVAVHSSVASARPPGACACCWWCPRQPTCWRRLRSAPRSTPQGARQAHSLERAGEARGGWHETRAQMVTVGCAKVRALEDRRDR
eukprot:9467822-Pyramimonas_sp.AAC.1